jgi:hypothetical protein
MPRFIRFPASAFTAGVLNTGAQTGTVFDGLSGTGDNDVTYRLVNADNVSPEFTPEAPQALYLPLGSVGLTQLNAMSLTRTSAISSEAEERDVLFRIVTQFATSLPASGDLSCTIAGVAASLVYSRATDNFAATYVYRATIPAGTSGNIVFTRTAGTGNIERYFAVWEQIRSDAVIDVAGVVSFANTLNAVDVLFDLSQSVAAGSTILSCTGGAAGGTEIPVVLTWTGAGFTETVASLGGGANAWLRGAFGRSTGLSAGTYAHSVEWTSANNMIRRLAYSLEVREP